MVFPAAITLLAVQRILEMYLARKNTSAALRRGGIEIDPGGYRVIVAMHAIFFVSLVAERYVLDTGITPLWPLLVTLFALAQGLRYWSIATLGAQWNTRIIVVPGALRVARGPYGYIDHPNYVCVILELAVVPLVFSCYFTAIVFSILNLAVLGRRVRIEEAALSKYLTG